MDFREHLEMAKDPNNILGIYNYCDAWCERCTFTSRCLTYKTHAKFEEEIEQERREEENKAFWDQVNDAVEDVKDLLDEKPKEDADFGFTGFDDIDDDDVEILVQSRDEARKQNKKNGRNRKRVKKGKIPQAGYET